MAFKSGELAGGGCLFEYPKRHSRDGSVGRRGSVRRLLLGIRVDAQAPSRPAAPGIGLGPVARKRRPTGPDGSEISPLRPTGNRGLYPLAQHVSRLRSRGKLGPADVPRIGLPNRGDEFASHGSNTDSTRIGKQNNSLLLFSVFNPCSIRG